VTLPSPRVRLAVAAGLFLAWLGWLAFLAVTARSAVVLSRPQLLVSNLYVVADVSGGAQPDAVVTVRKVEGPAADTQVVKAGDKLTVTNLPLVSTQEQGWTGPDQYVLALTRKQDGTCEVTPTPPSPGYPPDGASPADRLRIYRATADALAQLRALEGR
jgi:hypothetical protein